MLYGCCNKWSLYVFITEFETTKGNYANFPCRPLPPLNLLLTFSGFASQNLLKFGCFLQDQRFQAVFCVGEFSAEEMDLEVCLVGNWRTVGQKQVSNEDVFSP